MTAATTKPAPDQIRRARNDHPKLRERDLALQLGISEADYIAAHVGTSAIRIEPRVADVLAGLEAVGEVMALTRNESAVHEKIGVYDKVVNGTAASMVLGEDIDLRIFPSVWKYGFAVEKREGDTVRHSLQFFDAAGDAVHKVHLRDQSNLHAYQKLVDSLVSPNQEQTVETSRPDGRIKESAITDLGAARDELRERWSKLTDTHQFFGMLKSLKLERRQAMHMVGPDFAWQLDGGTVTALMNHVAAEAVPIMCFIGNRGCIQIHAGPIANIKAMGPWINILDEKFHMHLRTDHIREVWGVRKPTKDGHVTSVEAYDAKGDMIIQFFGKRKEGSDERPEWRFIAENLPRVPQSTAA